MNRSKETIQIEQFGKALIRLQDVLSKKKDEFLRDASIKRFEFTFELAWKTIKEMARLDGIETNSPRESIKAALRLGWVTDEKLWLAMLEARNSTSHAYSESTAEDIYKELEEYLHPLQDLLNVLSKIRAESI